MCELYWGWETGSDFLIGADALFTPPPIPVPSGALSFCALVGLFFGFFWGGGGGRLSRILNLASNVVFSGYIKEHSL